MCQYDMCMSKIDMHGWLWITLAGVHSGAKRLSMDQMNVSITDQLAGYVRKKVKSGRYNNASEVVREALRRMKDADARAARPEKPTAEDILTDLTEEQLDGIRRRASRDRYSRRLPRRAGSAESSQESKEDAVEACRPLRREAPLLELAEGCGQNVSE